MKRSFGQIIAAMILISFGVLLLLVNIGVIHLEVKELLLFSYPVLFLLLGIKILAGAIHPQKGSGSLFWGSFFILLGALLMLDRFDYISFSLSMVWKLWPLLLIYIGIQMFVFSKNNQNVRFENSFPVGDLKYNQPNWAVEPMNLWNAVGDYYFDFTKAYIPERETEINISGWVGDLKIILPEDLEFFVNANVNVGDIQIGEEGSSGIGRSYQFQTSGYEEAVKKLTFQVNLRVGDIRVERV